MTLVRPSYVYNGDSYAPKDRFSSVDRGPVLREVCDRRVHSHCLIISCIIHSAWHEFRFKGYKTCFLTSVTIITLTPYERYRLWNHQQLDCLYNSLFRLTLWKQQRSLTLVVCEAIHQWIQCNGQRATGTENIFMSSWIFLCRIYSTFFISSGYFLTDCAYPYLVCFRGPCWTLWYPLRAYWAACMHATRSLGPNILF